MPEGFDRVYTEVDGSGSVLRELLAYVRAGDSVTVEMGGELGGTASAIDTAAGHWQAVLSDLAMLTGRDTGDAARLSRFMEELHRCFGLVERRQMTVAEVCRKMSIGKTTYYRYWRKVKIDANELSISAACRQMNIGAGTYYRMRDRYKKEHSVPNVPNSE